MEPEPMDEAELRRYRLHRRFDRMGRLVGDDAMEKLLRSHVAVLGLGGVGSWTAEALARAGVGRLTLMDFDDICVTNANRQLHALADTAGRKKAAVMGERLRGVNPEAEVRVLERFYDAESSAEIFSLAPDFVVDAIDSIGAKCHLLAACRERGVPVVAATGSGGRLDPSSVRISDLSETAADPLARDLRRILREKHGFPEAEGAPFGIPAVWSPEPPRPPVELHYDGGKGFRCVCPGKEDSPFTCDSRRRIYGSAGFVTGAFGLACASVAVRRLLGEWPSSPLV
ncbi:MAG: tRNA threonylcarbamoyladenosine dehydratase [Elusimicrobia bacterium GWA2_69_24]|nr:MAG: tRNA threonylcarbamoyladenosine dehydratase [Elusimicrobia bacterium GWA2_69_24]HBL15294.1 tRNA threonylcarbamoyladenosine dehydratase [Elusimicrobiota bacterium]